MSALSHLPLLDRRLVRVSPGHLLPLRVAAMIVLIASVATAVTPTLTPADADLLAKVPLSLRTGPDGSPLDAESMGKLKKGDVVVGLIDVPDNPVKKGVALAVVDAPPGKVFATCGDYARFHDFMPYVAKTTVDSHEGNTTVVSYWLEFPLGVGNRNYQLKLIDGAKTVDGLPIFASEWTYTGQGNLNDTYGSWYVAPWGDGTKTLLRYTVFTDPGGHIPNWVKNAAAKSAIGKVMTQVKKRVASKDAAPSVGDLPPVPTAEK